MAHESFEDSDIAKFMNQEFVNIKVDREERPDIDSIYMAATQAISGQGGWPMTVFLNHELEPYYAGTYFPPTAMHGLPSFRDLIEAMADAWKNQRPLIDESVEQITEQLRKQNSKLQNQVLERDQVLESAINELRKEFDLNHAGFGPAPKFPPHTTLQFLLRYLAIRPNPEVMGWVERTAMKMTSGGMYDQIGGGFARYSVDNRWLVPHFEKMLYDNALLLDVYAELSLRTKHPRYLSIVRDTAEFVLRELQCEEGGFASSIDADSEGEEGKYYVFDLDDLAAALGEKATVAGEVFKVTPSPSFEHGKSVLRFDDQVSIAPDELETLKQKMLAYRERRVTPARDDKVLTGWNGWMIQSLFKAAAALGDERYAISAKRALDYLLSRHLQGEKLIRSSLAGVRSTIAGQLEDWAGLGMALLSAHAHLGEKRYFEKAVFVAAQVSKRFKSDVLYDTEERFTQTPVRPRTLSDSGYPSSHSIAAELFRQLWLITGNNEYLSQANEILDELSGLMAAAPRALSSALRALMGMEGAKEYAVVGPGSELHHFVLRLPDDGSVISAGNPGETALLKGREMLDGKSTVYLCERFSCKLPVTSLAALRLQLESVS